MSVHLTEEEQVIAMKRWWKTNGKIIVIAIVVAIAGYFAWTSWQDKQRSTAEDASLQYDSLLKLMKVEPGKTLSDADRTTAEHIVSQLKEKNAKTLYATNAAFFLAKLAVESGNLDKAVKELQWILSVNTDVAITQLARVRLARVFIAKESYAEASAQLLEEPSKGFASEYAEVRGDLLQAQGNTAAALTAYEKAIADTDPQHQERVMILQMKVDNLKAPGAVIEASTSPAPEKVQ
ncbi:MAG: tetratricopeptide repeat protein [Pseudomonadota bacterium]